ncbi:MAG: hypothetical protein HZA54_11175 [Planctomycetes bacterium]|nr:hypothetical protein [Planctomycetota bacterium]
MTELNDVVQVGAVFGRDGKKLQPVWFAWRGRPYRLTRATYAWSGRDGQARVHHFSVLDEQGNCYELTYHAETMVWRLAGVQEVT